MSEPDALERRFAEELGRFLQAVQTERVADAAKFEKIYSDAVELSRTLKGHTHLSKALLHWFRAGVEILRSEAPYIPVATDVVQRMANRLEMIFDLILMDEVPEDRTPGVPRVF